MNLLKQEGLRNVRERMKDLLIFTRGPTWPMRQLQIWVTSCYTETKLKVLGFLEIHDHACDGTILELVYKDEIEIG
jgi:hypothetical protein